jgi:transposase
MTNGQVEVITSVDQRRCGSPSEKRRLVAATLEPDASVPVPAIAREAGVNPSQLWGWRRQMRMATASPAGVASMHVASEAASAGRCRRFSRFIDRASCSIRL